MIPIFHRDRGDSFVPSIALQCWGFMAGSALFALGSAPVMSERLGAMGANLAFFVGSWFFTMAACIQLASSGPAMVVSQQPAAHQQMAIRAIWLAAAVQVLGTILFNINTSEALSVYDVDDQRRLVWAPNADGCVAFLISSILALVPLFRRRLYWAPRSVEWSGSWLNLLGSVAFAVSAVGSIITPSGSVANAPVANLGTFTGAILFFAAATLGLRQSADPAGGQGQDDAHR